MNGCGLYIHVPFCEKKCTYCAFYSVADSSLRQKWIDALLREAQLRAENEVWQSFSFSTLYWGGGSPSILPVPDLVRLFEGLSRIFDLSQLNEITFELNPEHRNKISDLWNYTPIRRLSIGIQSFRTERLLWMQRRNTGQEGIQTLEAVQKQGFEQVSIDLIYGLPSMDLAEWTEQLAWLDRFSLSHFSAYALTVEPQTPLYKQVKKLPLLLPNNDLLFSQYMQAVEWGKEHGFEAYEVSAWAKAGAYAQHNRLYWDATSPYLGLGPGAHSFCSPFRRANLPNLALYTQQAYSSLLYSEETIDEKMRYHEYLMTSLRTQWGIEKKYLKQFCPKIQAEFASKISPFITDNLISETENAYIPSAKARYMADGIALRFF